MPEASAPPLGCPVCARPTGPETACAECGWLLRGPRRPGPVTDELRQDFCERLSRSQREFDAHVAALIPVGQRDVTKIRGGPPSAAEWAQAHEAAVRVRAGTVGEQALRGIVADTLRGLSAPGPADASASASSTIAEIDASGITVTRARLDQFGSPQITPDERSAAWADLLPMLSRAEAERHFQLAGGIAGLDRASLWESLRHEVPGRTEGCVLVVCRPAGWRIVERAALLACAGRPSVRLVRAVAPEDGTAPGRLVSSVATEGPVLREYVVPVAIADPLTGDVRVQSSPLFAPGDPVGAEALLSLRRLPGDRGDIAVAVMVGNGEAPRLLSLLSVPQPRAAAYHLRAMLDGPGRVRLTQPAGQQPESRSWPEILAGLPSRVDVLLCPVDLVCAMELSGPRERVRQRQELVRDLLTLLDAEYPEPGRLRVALAGCTDHVFDPGRERRKVVLTTPLGSAGQALSMLGKAAGNEARHPSAAPLEDLLHEAAGLLCGSPGEHRAARLLLVAGRLPHPYPLNRDNVHPCPLRYNWRAELRRLTGRGAARCVTVADEIPGRQVLRAVWQELGRAGLHQLSASNAQEIGEDLGVLVRHAQRIPIPLADLEAGTR